MKLTKKHAVAGAVILLIGGVFAYNKFFKKKGGAGGGATDGGASASGGGGFGGGSSEAAKTSGNTITEAVILPYAPYPYVPPAIINVNTAPSSRPPRHRPRPNGGSYTPPPTNLTNISGGSSGGNVAAPLVPTNISGGTITTTPVNSNPGTTTNTQMGAQGRRVMYMNAEGFYNCSGE